MQEHFGNEPDSGAGRRRALALLGRLRHDRRGQTVVEFALIVPVLLALLLGIISLGFYINAYLTLAQATRIAVREASLGYATGLSGTTCPQPGSSGTICNALSGQVALGAGMSAANLSYVCVASAAGSGTTLGTVEVAITYDYVPVVPLPGVGKSIVMNQTYTMVQETAPTTAYAASCS